MPERSFHFIKNDPMFMTPSEREVFNAREEDRRFKKREKSVEVQLDKLEKYKKGFDALIKKFMPGQQTTLQYIETHNDGMVIWELCLFDQKKPTIKATPNYKIRFRGTANDIDEQLNDYLEEGKWME